MGRGCFGGGWGLLEGVGVIEGAVCGAALRSSRQAAASGWLFGA